MAAPAAAATVGTTPIALERPLIGLTTRSIVLPERLVLFHAKFASESRFL